MKQRIPALLNPGDVIGLGATARFATLEMVHTAKKHIEAAGYQCYFHPSILKKDGQVAGSISERVDAFNHLIDHKDVRAIWNIRGGYGSAEIVDDVNWGALKLTPKWLIGFSDFTTFLCHANQHGLFAIHAPMPISFALTAPKHLQQTFELLATGKQSVALKSSTLSIKGTVVAGNLSVIYSIYGTKSLPDLKQCILFLEDLDEYHYHIDRMLLALKRKGAFDELQAVVLGTFSDIHDHEIKWGSSIDHTLAKHFNDSGVPVILDFPLGHTADNSPLITGVSVTIEGGVMLAAL
ncbi:MAG TPA: hypothetical protein DCZ98_06070 [Cryomorphaceae bacterium]|nr:hypothetical protein [Cryomorphaceae bacterium]